mmetsp:Transcript_30627/g.72887  ORF Transcript_30627/g.72887 Transcript_30627/m.72887 type:complete len:190 (+) Transcript_30627:183-752(+)
MVSVRSGILMVAVTSNCNGFRIPNITNSNIPATRQRTTGLQLEKDGEDGTTLIRSSRRDFIRNAATIAAGGEFFLSQPAEATYTAFTQREEDWKAREKKGEIQISSAASLRKQLREIAPMNDEGSKIFCPNGASAAVSPLMENKCGDRQALPSVYGRSDDAMGNSVPGFGGSAPQLRAELARESYFREN